MRYFQRSITTRDSAIGACVIYAVREVPREERTDPVRCYGGFPLTWRPTMNPGEVLWDPQCREQYWFCEVPRNQFRHYREIGTVEALEAYPGLAVFPATPRPIPANP